jgi:hypothetical protein
MSMYSIPDCNRFKIFSLYIIVILSTFLFLWCLLIYQFHTSNEAIVSSFRIMIESYIILFLIEIYREKIWRVIFIAIIIIDSLNLFISIIQLLQNLNVIYIDNMILRSLIPRNISNEQTRVNGFLDGFQLSSFFMFFTIVLLLKDKRLISSIMIFLNMILLLFSARVFILFLPFLIFSNRRLLLYFFTILIIFSLYCFIDIKILQSNIASHLFIHFNNLIFPAFDAFLHANPQLDYSAADTLTHYQVVLNASDVFIGNGEARFSNFGGKDPMISRWLVQSGLPAALIMITIVSIILFRLFKEKQISIKIFASALLLATFKGELIDTILVYPVLLSYSFSRV